MDQDLGLFLLADMLRTAALVAAPVLIVTMAVGLLVSVFQVVTQLQEMTLTFVPKLAAVVLTLLAVGGWMFAVMAEFAERVIAGSVAR